MMTVTYRVDGGLYVNMTNRCTNNCDFCIRRNGESAYGSESLWLEREPAKEEVLAAIKAEKPDYKEIVFCGYGEPTCRLHDLLWVARELRGFTDKPLRLNTNGQASLILGEDAAPLFEGCFDVISISLNEATAEKYDAICHSRFGTDAFEGLLDFAARVRRYVPQVYFSVVRQFLSPESLALCERISEERGVPLRIREYIK